MLTLRSHSSDWNGTNKTQQAMYVIGNMFSFAKIKVAAGVSGKG